MNRTRAIRSDVGAEVSAGAVRFEPHPWLSRWRARRTGDRTNVYRRARIAAGTLCGLGMALFPGLAILAIQVCLVLAWAYFMVSLVVGGLRGVGRGLR